MDLQVHVLVTGVFIALLVSAFFSGSETAVMALNRYRLQHQARKGHRGARHLVAFVASPERTLSLILIGNTFANVLASAMTTMLAGRYGGEYGVLFASLGLTLVILVVSEMVPKTVSARYPERIAYRVVTPLRALMVLLGPLVWVLTGVANRILLWLGLKPRRQWFDPLSHDELRGLLTSQGQDASHARQHMLMGVMDLESVRVEDVMTLKQDVVGLNLDEAWDQVVRRLSELDERSILVYRGDIDQVLGVLPMRRVVDLLIKQRFNRHTLERCLAPVHYIPAGVSLAQQLHHFLRLGYELGLVVNEFGQVVGQMSMGDITEEIVGEGAHEDDAPRRLIHPQTDGSVLVKGHIHVRDLNRLMGWQLPMEGPNTLSGLVVEHLQTLPTQCVGLRVAGFPMEISRLRDQEILEVRVYPKLLEEA